MNTNEHWHCWGVKRWAVDGSPLVPICTHRREHHSLGERSWECDRWTADALQDVGLRPDPSWTTRCVNDDPCPHSRMIVEEPLRCDRCGDAANRNIYIANNQWYMLCRTHFEEMTESPRSV